MKYEINLNSINTKLYILPQLHNLQCIPFFSITYLFFCNELKRTIRSKGGNDSFSVLFVSFVAKFCFSWIVWHWVYCILLNQHFCRPTESWIDRTLSFSIINRLLSEHPPGLLNQPTKFVINILNLFPTSTVKIDETIKLSGWAYIAMDDQIVATELWKAVNANLENHLRVSKS